MSEAVGQVRPRPRGETRRRILNIAADWLQQRGYHGFSFAQIADALEIRSGAVHYHFRGKADLVEAVFARYREEFAWWCNQLPEGPGRSVDWIERFLDLEAKNIDRGRVCPLGLAGVEFASLPAAACREAEALRDELRDWHKIADARVGMDWQNPSYWVQYKREYPQDVMKWYVEDQVTFGGITLSAGAKQFLVEVERNDLFGASPDATVDSDSDVLFSGGVVWNVMDSGLELFGGYAENFKSISDNILERPSADLGSIEPETSENIDVGLRYQNDSVYLTATYFESDFENRIIFLAPGSGAGNDYLIGTNGTYINAGGIESSGFELAATWNVTDRISLYGAFTSLDATYIGTGNSDADAQAGIVRGNDVTGIADTMWVLTADYAASNFTAGISAKSTGERAVNVANTWYADEYTVIDAYISVEGGNIADSLKGLTVNAQIFNLTDEDYLGTINSNAGWLGAPRTATVSLVYDF